MTWLSLALLLSCGGGDKADKNPVPGADDKSATTQAPPAAMELKRDETRPVPRHALLLVVDTLRADVVAEVNTPVLDGLAKMGASVDLAWAAGTWTAPSVISLFTGMPVREHGWNLPTGRLGKYPMIPKLPTIATVLKKHDFETFGLYANPYLAEKIGFERGFDTWKRSADRAMPKQFAKHVEQTWGDGKRHYAYVHLIGPHSPLRPSEEARERWGVDPSFIDEKQGFGIGEAKRNKPEGAREAYAKGYRAVVEDMDALVGTIIDGLGPYRDETLVIVTSDHGELLGEHDVVGHGTWVYEELTHVPLIIDHAASVPPSLSLASIPAIITEFLGVEATWPTPAGRPLPLVSEREDKLAITADGQHKGIWEVPKVRGAAPDAPPPEPVLSVFDLVADPHELSPLTDDHGMPAQRADFETRFKPGETSLEQVTLHPDTVEELKALGYLGEE